MKYFYLTNQNMKTTAYEESLKNLLMVTTKKIPNIDTDDKYFSNNLNILGLSERYTFIKSYFENESTIDVGEYLRYRNYLKEKLNSEYISLKPIDFFMKLKHSYGRELTYKKDKLKNGTYIVVDIKSACYQMFHKYGLYEEETWYDHLKKHTNNEFILKYDTSFMYDCFNKDETAHAPFNQGIVGLIQTVIDSGLDAYMKEYGFFRENITTDAIWYYGINIEELKDNWIKGDVKTFGDVSVHYRIMEVSNVKFTYDGINVINTIYQKELDNKTIFTPSEYLETYPQIKRLLENEPVSELDLHYLKGSTCPPIIMVK